MKVHQVTLAARLDVEGLALILHGVKVQTVRFETLQRRKCKLRAEEAQRLTARIVTPAQMQEENSLVPINTPIRILNLSSSLKKHYAR